MTTKIFCPVDGSEMELTGDQGIVDYEGNWDAQASRYECANKKHTIFVVDSDCIIEPGESAFEAAEKAIVDALQDAAWRPMNKYVRLRRVQETYELSKDGYEDPITSLENLRSELAKRAVDAFKDEVDENPDGHNFENVAYEYIHAIEDVDDVLEDAEWQKKLEEMGWLRRN